MKEKSPQQQQFDYDKSMEIIDKMDVVTKREMQKLPDQRDWTDLYTIEEELFKHWREIGMIGD